MNAEDMRKLCLRALDEVDVQGTPIDVRRAGERWREIFNDLGRRPIHDDDLIYLRRGARGVVLARVLEVGSEKDEGLLIVRVWSETGSRFLAPRKVPLEDERGFPSERDPRVRAMRRAIESAKKGC